MTKPLSLYAEKTFLLARISRKRRAHQSTAADEALLIQITNKILRAEIRARKRKAA